MLHSSANQHGKRSKKTYTYKYIYVNTLLKIKQKKKTIRGAVFVRRLRLVAFIQRTLLLLAELSQVSSTLPNRAEGAWYKSVIQ